MSEENATCSSALRVAFAASAGAGERRRGALSAAPERAVLSARAPRGAACALRRSSRWHCARHAAPGSNDVAHSRKRPSSRCARQTRARDGGGLLLRETDRRLNLLPRLAECFLDRRSPLLVKHSVAQMMAQRVYGLALGYEDLNDHEQLRQDPLLDVLAGKPEMDQPLAGKSTLNRLELPTIDAAHCSGCQPCARDRYRYRAITLAGALAPPGS